MTSTALFAGTGRKLKCLASWWPGAQPLSGKYPGPFA